MFGFGCIEPFSGLSKTGMAALGIFIGTIFAWLTISVDWPGCISMVAIIVFGVATYTQVFQWSLGSWVSTLCIFSFLLGAALESSGWTKRIAAWFITLPMAKQSPWKLIILFFTGALVLAAISPFPAYFVFSFVAKEIFVQAGYKKEDNFPKMMMMGLLVCVQIAQGMVQWTPWVIVPFTIANQVGGVAIPSVLKTFLFGGILGILIVAATIAAFRFILNPDVSKLTNVDTDKLLRDIQPMSLRKKLTVGIFIFTLILWTMPSILASAFPTFTVISTWGTAFPPLFGCMLLCLIRVDDEPLLDFKKAMSEKVSWSAIFLIMVTMLLATMLTQPEVGFNEFLSKYIGAAISGMPSWLLILIIIAASIIITNFVSNNVVAAVLSSVGMPLVLQLYPEIDLNVLAALIGVTASYAFATPSATACSALLASDEWFDTKTLFKWGAIVSGISIIFAYVIGYPLANAVF